MSVLRILVPMAGRGSRFQTAGYTLPKPLIDMGGKKMIQVVIENLRPRRDHQFIFVCQNEHIQENDLRRRLDKWAPGCGVVGIDGITEGAACTVLLAEEYIDNGDPLIIANSDQWVDVSMDTFLSGLDQDPLDGLIMTMKATDPKWSYVKFDERGNVTGVIEKVVVSDEATVGIYYFRFGAEYCRCAHEMIRADDRSKGEFYVAPVYNYLIRSGRKVGIFNIGSDRDGMYGLGIPEDLEYFLNQPISRKALEDQ